MVNVFLKYIITFSLVISKQLALHGKKLLGSTFKIGNKYCALYSNIQLKMVGAMCYSFENNRKIRFFFNTTFNIDCFTRKQVEKCFSRAYRKIYQVLNYQNFM